MTGLIYIAIIALWAAVLIPLWLRRHDQISEVRSTARFHSAMRSLGDSRNRQVVGLSFAGEAGAMEAVEYDSYGYSSADERLRAADLDYAAHSAAVRRGVVLGSLSAILALTLILAFVGTLPKWVPAIALLPVVGFLVAASMTAASRSQGSSTSSRERESGRRTTSRSASASVGASASSREAAHAERPARREYASEPAPVRADGPAARSAGTAMSDDEWQNWNAWDDDDSWDAVPTTLPTYVSKPRASQVPRRIDRSRPGEWTGEAMVETAQAMRSRPSSAYAEPVDAGAATAEIPVVQAPVARAVNE